MVVAKSDRLLERGAELERVEAVIDATVGEGGALAGVSGEAGIGKTALLAAAAARAEQQGLRVLHARGGFLERDFAYGIVRQLFDPVLARASEHERAELFEGAARLSAVVLEPAREVAPDAASALAISHGLFWFTAHLAAFQPVLLLIDDAQWADTASLRWAVFLARRLESMRIGLLVAWRTGEPGAHEELLEALMAEPLAEHVRPPALSLGAAATAIEDALGARPSEDFAAACYDLTCGNPFLLRELARAVRDSGGEGTDADVHLVRDLTPHTVASSVLRRLAALPPDATKLARAAAILDTDAAVSLTASLAGLDSERATAAGDALQRAEILEGHERLRFRHPILRLAIYRELTAPQQSAAHRRAAELLDVAGQPDRSAVHLLPVAPAGDGWVVDQLQRSAFRALDRGAPDAAIPLLERALAEPPAPARLPSVLLSRGRAAAATVAPDSEAILRRALESAADAQQQAAAADELSRVLALMRRFADAIAVLDEVARQVAVTDAERAAELEIMSALLYLTGVVGDLREVEQVMRLLGQRLELSLALRFAASTAELGAAVSRKLDQPPERLAEYRSTVRASLPEALDLLGPSHPSFGWMLVILSALGDFEGALDVEEVVTRAARRRGDVPTELMTMALRGRILWYLGRLDEAESHGRIALDAGVETGYTVLRVLAGATVAYAQALRNELADAEQVLSMFALEGGGVGASTTFDATLYGARAELRMAQGRPDEALEDLEVYFGVFARGNGVPPYTSVRALRTRALMAAGRRDEALAWARQEVDRFRPHGPRDALGMSLATLGLAEGCAPGLACLEEAVAVLRGSQRRLELGRALIELGAARRRARHRAEAREPLQEGMELAHLCGAPALVERAREELEATGARPRRIMRSGLDALTPSERRVADLACQGMTNAQIAQTLFVTPKTVETHLRHIFQKLDITSRGALAGRLSA